MLKKIPMIAVIVGAILSGVCARTQAAVPAFIFCQASAGHVQYFSGVFEGDFLQIETYKKAYYSFVQTQFEYNLDPSAALCYAFPERGAASTKRDGNEVDIKSKNDRRVVEVSWTPRG